MVLRVLPFPVSVQFEPPVYLMVAGSVISTPIWVLFAPPPQCHPRKSHGSSWYTSPSGSTMAWTQALASALFQFFMNTSAFGCGHPTEWIIRPFTVMCFPAL